MASEGCTKDNRYKQHLPSSPTSASCGKQVPGAASEIEEMLQAPQGTLLEEPA